MSYLVMECHPGYAVLLDEEGRFLKAANLRYEIGQTVYDPVLMKDTPEKQRHTIRWISSGIAAIAACFLLLFGFSYYQNYMRPYSRYLTVGLLTGFIVGGCIGVLAWAFLQNLFAIPICASIGMLIGIVIGTVIDYEKTSKEIDKIDDSLKGKS